MNAIQTKALQDAIARLTAIGATFAIVDPDGQKHGTLEIAASPSHRKVNNFMQYGYQEKVRAMQVGDVLTFDEMKDHPEARMSYQGSILTCGIKAFGKGSMMSCTTEGGAIEVLRVS